MHDFHAADVRRAGRDAPFSVPVWRNVAREGPIAVVNIGGVSNITTVTARKLIAATRSRQRALDVHMFRSMVQRFDKEGDLPPRADRSGLGVACAETAIFDLKPPKSLDRVSRV
jgi:anhydro-N-acetylmuramic acid kinase